MSEIVESRLLAVMAGPQPAAVSDRFYKSAFAEFLFSGDLSKALACKGPKRDRLHSRNRT